jgi:hypothetical protein
MVAAENGNYYEEDLVFEYCEAELPRVKTARAPLLQRMKSERQHGCRDPFFNVDECHWNLTHTRKYG